MNNLQLYNFNEYEIRVVLDEHNEPWWVAKDVCDVLGYPPTRISELMGTLDEDEKDYGKILTPGGSQKMYIINEPGLYSLVMRSPKPQAKAFKRWVTHEVLPSIRKTGSYSVKQLTRKELAQMVIDAEAEWYSTLISNNHKQIWELTAKRRYKKANYYA